MPTGPAAPDRSLPDVPCYLAGEYVSLPEARLHPLDRGFLFGDAVYEVVKVVAGRALLLSEHLERLGDGLRALRIAAQALAELSRVVPELIRRSAMEEGSVYLQVSRGGGPREKIPRGDRPATVFAYPQLHAHPAHASRRLRAITRPDIRWGRCDVKTVSLAATVLGKLAAGDAGVDEVVFVGPDGALREGGSTNLLVRHDDRLWTHPADVHILPGITRRLVLDLARQSGLSLVEAAPRLVARDEWQEALLCGTLTGLQPLVELDGEPIAEGVIGDWTRRLAGSLDSWENRLSRNLC